MPAKLRCSICEKYLPEDAFDLYVIDDSPNLNDKYDSSTVSAVTSRGNRQYHCKECSHAYNDQWRADNPEKVQEYSEQYYRNMSALAEAGDPKGLKWREDQRKSSRKYNEKNINKKRAADKERYAKLRALAEAGDPKAIEWRENLKRRQREYYKNNPQIINKASKSYYDKMKALRDAGDPKGIEWWEKRKAIARRNYARKKARDQENN
jgi:hypothetical protein